VIAIDANVLVRYLVGDDPTQSEIAAHFIETELTPERPGFISLVAVVEFSWVLRRLYGASAETVTKILGTLLASSQIVVENPAAVERAIASPHDDLADALIHQVGRAAGCEKTVTFDRRFARAEGVELLSLATSDPAAPAPASTPR
jgi:predicted nucleic-acid-binding protein